MIMSFLRLLLVSVIVGSVAFSCASKKTSVLLKESHLMSKAEIISEWRNPAGEVVFTSIFFRDGRVKIFDSQGRTKWVHPNRISTVHPDPPIMPPGPNTVTTVQIGIQDSSH